MEFFQSIVGKIVTGAVALGVIVGGISWWWMDPSTRQTILTSTGHILIWFGIVLAFPWASFALIGWVARMDSNLAGGILVGAYTVAEAILLAGLFHWHMASAAGWAFLLLGALVAGVYNLLSCDWIAEKLT